MVRQQKAALDGEKEEEKTGRNDVLAPILGLSQSFVRCSTKDQTTMDYCMGASNGSSEACACIIAFHSAALTLPRLLSSRRARGSSRQMNVASQGR